MLRRRRTGISAGIGSLEWSKNDAVILLMEATFGTGSFWTCLRFSETMAMSFHMVQDFPTSPNWRGYFEYLKVVGNSGVTTRSLCAFVSFIFWMSWCQLVSHGPYGSFSTFLGAPPFWTVRRRCPWGEAEMEGAGYKLQGGRSTIKQHMLACPRLVNG